MENIKRLIKKFDEYAQYISNFAVFITILLATAYFVFPDLRRFVEINITNRGAWYYVGAIKPQTEKWASQPQTKEEEKQKIKPTLIKNFYHSNWKVENTKINVDVINHALGNIVVHDAPYPVMGRAKESAINGDYKKSNNQIIAVATSNDCFYVKQIDFADTGPIDHDTYYIWMFATKITCH